MPCWFEVEVIQKRITSANALPCYPLNPTTALIGYPHQGSLEISASLNQSARLHNLTISTQHHTMNLALTDPFVLGQDYPESTTHHLRSGHTGVVRFNRKGDYLAAGRVDGVVVIWDMETLGLARKLKGHIRQIQSLSWSRDGRYILSSAQDWKVILWDLQDGSMLRMVRFEAPVYIAELHPFDQ